MIVIDIETTGTNPNLHAMLSLGAVDYDSGEEFYGECSIEPTSEIDPIALGINGFNIDEIQPGMKRSAENLYLDFLYWSGQFPDRFLAGHNVGHLDILFLEKIHEKLGPFPFGYRTLDLHSVAFMVLRKSLSHSAICDALGLPQEPKPHNALAGAKSERAAFQQLFSYLK